MNVVWNHIVYVLEAEEYWFLLSILSVETRQAFHQQGICLQLLCNGLAHKL